MSISDSEKRQIDAAVKNDPWKFIDETLNDQRPIFGFLSDAVERFQAENLPTPPSEK